MASDRGEHPPRGDGPRVDVAFTRGPLWFRSDERLAQWATEGDERAFAAIFRRYRQELYRFSLGIVGDPDDAQDALQATMVKALRALPGERREVQLKPWLYRIAHNESVELLRRRRVAEELEPELPSAAPQPPERVEQRTRLRALLDDLEDLPERQRGALVMRELSGLDFEEIAGALQASPAVARQTIYEARTSLRQMEDGREMACESVTLALSEGDGRVSRRRDLRAHLRGCSSCRRFREEMREREADFAAIGTVPVVVSTVLLGGVVSGGKVATGGGLSGQFAGALGSSAFAKTAATAAVVATVGVSVAQPGGSVDDAVPGGGPAERSQRSPGAGELAESATPQVAIGPAPAVATAKGSGRTAGSGARPDAGGDSNGAPSESTEPAADAPQAAPPAGATGHGPAAVVPQRDDPAAVSPDAANPGREAGSQSDREPAVGPPADRGEPQARPPDTAPGQSALAPGQSGSAPGLSDEAPGHSGDAPGHSNDARGNSADAPGHDGDDRPGRP